jgi:hypothetical protein
LKHDTSKREPRGPEKLTEGDSFEETMRRKQMREAAEFTDRLRESSKTPGWSGAAEIRKWRDRDQRSLKRDTLT